MRRVNVIIISSLIASNMIALDLNSAIRRVITTNPKIIQKKKEFNSIYETLKVAQGDFFLPSIDLSGGRSKVKTNYKTTDTTSKYTNKFFTISATENLFNGFGTVKDIDAKKSMLASSAYSYIQTVNELGLQAAKAYLDVMRNRELLVVEEDNYRKHRKIFRAIQARSRAGVGIIGDFQEIKAKTSLAYANYLAQRKNLMSSEINLKKLIGYDVDINSLVSPTVGESLVYTLPQAKEFAFTHNPSLFVQKYNVITARYNMQRDRKEFLPKVDLVVSKSYVKGRNDDTQIDTDYNTYSAGINFNWNIFRGFKDVHTRNKNISLIHSEHQKYNAIKRDLSEEIELAWMSYNMQQREYQYLQNYLKNAREKMQTLTKLFRVGKKSLFEFLAAQTDYNNAKEKLINTKYDLIFTKFRVFKAMGILPDMIDPNIKAEVGITNNGLYDYRNLIYAADKLPVPKETIQPEVSQGLSYDIDSIGVNTQNQYAIVSPTYGYESNKYSYKSRKKIVRKNSVVMDDMDDLNDEKEQEVYDEEYIAPNI